MSPDVRLVPWRMRRHTVRGVVGGAAWVWNAADEFNSLVVVRLGTLWEPMLGVSLRLVEERRGVVRLRCGGGLVGTRQSLAGRRLHRRAGGESASELLCGWCSNDSVAGIVAGCFGRSADGAEVSSVVVAAPSWWSADRPIIRQRRLRRAVGKAAGGQSRTWWIWCGVG